MKNKRALIVIGLAILAFLYFSGRMDHALVNVGLNFKPCAHNGFGATMCGDELKSYCQNLVDNHLDPGAGTEDTCSRVNITLTSSGDLLNTPTTP